MVAPLVVVGASVVASIAALIPYGVQKIAKEELLRIVAGDIESELEEAAIATAFEKMGLTIEPKEGLSGEAITKAINNGPLAGSGVELTNAFDKEALKRDLMKVALQQAAQAFGLNVSNLTVENIKDELRRQVSKEVLDQVRAGAGELAESAKDLVELVREIDAYRKAIELYQTRELLMTNEAINNRERQAKYRASHKRIWVSK